MLSSILLVQAGSDMGLQNISSIKASAAWGLDVKLNVTTNSTTCDGCSTQHVCKGLACSSLSKYIRKNLIFFWACALAVWGDSCGWNQQ